jgi:type I restriction enzyme S subunit
MGGEWIECLLSDACRSIDYGLTAAAGGQDNAPRFLRITDIVSGWIDWKSVPHVVVDDATADKYKLDDGDIVLARTGASTGSSAYVKTPPPAVFASYLVRLKAKDGFDSRFLAYYLKSDTFWAFIRGVLGDKSAQPNASASTMVKAPLRAPRDVQEQRSIARILGTLDDKIDLNRRMSETLEAMARTLFKSWFVDFDPVRAKMAGRDPGLPKPLADLFPSRLVDSELGEIPEGWEARLAGQLFAIGIGKTPPRNEPQWFSRDDTDVPWISIKDMGHADAFIFRVSEYLTASAVDRFHIRQIPTDTVVLSFKLTVGRVAITDGSMVSNEAIAHFVPRSTTFISAPFLYCYLRQFDYESLGSTSSIATAVNSQSVRAIPTIVPSQNVHGAFLRAVSAAFERLRLLQRESQQLECLRDALLPKLVSGELRVRNADKLVASQA